MINNKYTKIDDVNNMWFANNTLNLRAMILFRLWCYVSRLLTFYLSCEICSLIVKYNFYI